VSDKRQAYNPSGAALSLWSDRSSEIVLSGPAGTGKTRALLEKGHALALFFPGTRILLARKTRQSLTETALVTFERDVTEGDSDPVVTNSLRRVRQSYLYSNGSELVVAGLDNPSRIMSTEFDMVLVPEATELLENDWEFLLTRLRNGKAPWQQIIGDCNPGGPNHWIRRRANRGALKLCPSTHKDNPRFWDAKAEKPTPAGEQYFALLDRLTGVRRLRLRDGIWAAAEGLVYDCWDESIHVVDPFPIPDDWRIYEAIDFGYTNPFVCQWWARSPDDDLFLVREWYKSRVIVQDHAEKIKELRAGRRIEASISDHGADERATLKRHGVNTRPATKSITEGVQEMLDRLTPQDGRPPRLRVFRDSLVERDPAIDEAKLPCGFAEEILSYAWPVTQDGKAIKEVPAPGPDHSMDAARYMCMHMLRKRALIA
jgi:phage terminase large subunit